jgi:hypothetical protein
LIKNQKDIIKEAAIEYANMGLPVIECNGKAPVAKRWPNIKFTNKDDIPNWYKRKNQIPSVGLVLGRNSNIIGIDVDGTEAMVLLNKKAKGDLPKTWSYKTPGGGMRFLYKINDGIKLKKRTIKLDGEHAELAFLCTGQQTILPPSIHPNGGIYKWTEGCSPSDIEIATTPQWLLDEMTFKSVFEGKIINGNEFDKLGEFNANYQLRKIAEKCPYFKNALTVQEKEGLSEEEWYLICDLLVETGNFELAFEFSKKSLKHNERSKQRINDMITKASDGETKHGWVKCITFGCNKRQISTCFKKVNYKDDTQAEITNSPGIIVDRVTRIMPPSQDIYQEYLKELQQIDGVYLDDEGQLCSLSSEGQKIVLANFIARIKKEIVKTDGFTDEKIITIEGVLRGGIFLKPIDIKVEEYERFDWPIKVWGVKPIIHAGYGIKDIIRDITQRVSKYIEHDFIYKHIGWCRLTDGTLCYLHNGGAIGADNVNVELEEFMRSYTFPGEVTDLSLAIKSSLKLLNIAPMRLTIPLLSFIYLSPLVHFFIEAGLSPNFVVWLFGITGSMKTSLALVALSHFGDFVYKSPPASFKDTANALERKAHVTKDAPLLIDDFHPNEQQGEAAALAKIAESLLRRYGDRISRGRLTQNITFNKSFVPLGMGLVSGEDLPTGQSSTARLVALELKKGDINLEILTEMQNNSLLLNEAMQGYLEWIISKADDIPSILNKDFKRYRAKFQQNNVHGRIIDAACYLKVAFNLLIEYAYDSNAITLEYKKELRKISYIEFNKMILSQFEKMEDQKVELVFMITLKELIDTGKVYLVDIEKPQDNDLIVGGGDFIGYYDKHIYYLYPQVVYNCVNKFLFVSRKTIPVSAKMLWKNLKHAKMIKTEESGSENDQNLPKKMVLSNITGKKQRSRLLHLYRQCLDEVG